MSALPGAFLQDSRTERRGRVGQTEHERDSVLVLEAVGLIFSVVALHNIKLKPNFKKSNNCFTLKTTALWILENCNLNAHFPLSAE